MKIFKALFIPTLMLAIIGFVVSIGLVGCGEPRLPTAKRDNGAKTYHNDAGQRVECVLTEDFETWLQNHKNIKILSITAVSDTKMDHNRTSHLVILYQEL
jgi:hypothetical protein